MIIIIKIFAQINVHTLIIIKMTMINLTVILYVIKYGECKITKRFVILMNMNVNMIQKIITQNILYKKQNNVFQKN